MSSHQDPYGFEQAVARDVYEPDVHLTKIEAQLGEIVAFTRWVRDTVEPFTRGSGAKILALLAKSGRPR